MVACQTWNEDDFSMVVTHLLHRPNFRADFFSIRQTSLLSWSGFQVRLSGLDFLLEVAY